MTHLYEIAENCAFGINKNDQIRDAFVIKIIDRDLSDEMQIKDEFTLKKDDDNDEAIKASQITDSRPEGYMGTRRTQGSLT